MAIKVTAAGLSDAGRVRQKNEDWFYLRVVQSLQEKLAALFIVADGMGGHLAGEVASQLTVATLESEFNRDPKATRKLSDAELQAARHGGRATRKLSQTTLHDAIRQSVQRANQVVRNYARRYRSRAGSAGSTVTMAVLKGWTAHVANVGDSRTYLFRDKRLEQLTQDHSLVASLVAAGQIKPEEIYTHPQRNVIYRSLGDKPGVKVDIFQQELQAGDTLLLCSDGLWEMVRDPQISKIVEKAPGVWEACRRLVKAANDNGGEDNVTVIVARVE